MTLPIIGLRPEPGCSATISAGREAGLIIEGFSLFEVRPLEWDAPPPDAFDALLLGSANALRHGGPALAAYRGKPAFAVGEATGRAAQAAGLELVGTGRGVLQALVDSRPDLPPRLLRMTGAEHGMMRRSTGSTRSSAVSRVASGETTGPSRLACSPAAMFPPTKRGSESSDRAGTQYSAGLLGSVGKRVHSRRCG